MRIPPRSTSMRAPKSGFEESQCMTKSTSPAISTTTPSAATTLRFIKDLLSGEPFVDGNEDGEALPRAFESELSNLYKLLNIKDLSSYKNRQLTFRQGHSRIDAECGVVDFRIGFAAKPKQAPLSTHQRADLVQQLIV